MAASGEAPIAQPVTPSMQPSIHQPSRTLKFMIPLCDAFMSLVPDASIGGFGVLSQTLTSEVSFAGVLAVVVFVVDNFDFVFEFFFIL